MGMSRTKYCPVTNDMSSASKPMQSVRGSYLRSRYTDGKHARRLRVRFHVPACIAGTDSPAQCSWCRRPAAGLPSSRATDKMQLCRIIHCMQPGLNKCQTGGMSMTLPPHLPPRGPHHSTLPRQQGPPPGVSWATRGSMGGSVPLLSSQALSLLSGHTHTRPQNSCTTDPSELTPGDLPVAVLAKSWASSVRVREALQSQQTGHSTRFRVV